MFQDIKINDFIKIQISYKGQISLCELWYNTWICKRKKYEILPDRYRSLIPYRYKPLMYKIPILLKSGKMTIDQIRNELEFQYTKNTITDILARLRKQNKIVSSSGRPVYYELKTEEA